MGQQQYLIVILVSILVGLATIIAINTFGEADKQSAEDAVRVEMLRAASNAQAYYRKPADFDGGGYSYAAISFNHISLDSLNENGTFEISNRNQDSFILTGIPRNNGDSLSLEVYSHDLAWQ